MSAGRALEAALDAMHGLVAEGLITEMQMHLRLLREHEHGDEPYMIPPQFLDKVLKFLAQNGINAPRQAPRVDALAATLADLDLDEIASRPN